MFGKWPHEAALGRNDAPGSDIELSLVVFDIQCVLALAQEQAKAAREARKKRVTDG